MRCSPLAIVALLGCTTLASSCGRRQPIPVTVEPFYDANGPKVAVGKFSDGLAARDKKAFLKTPAAMKEEWSELPAEAMYVAAIRLYDFGLKDDAVYWFYSAQYRASLVRGLLDHDRLNAVGNPATALVQAHEAFLKQAGPYINGYAFGDIEKLLHTIAQVQAEGVRLPMLKQLYPNVVFIPEDRWQKINYELNTGFSEYMQKIRENADGIRAQRKISGMDGRY
ncbi:MAG: hypothetical protein N3B01_10445 [Verrucomicrobiae bacterium]|nr:hypothetical protein [Verrucomicrobiae bacterium]